MSDKTVRYFWQQPYFEPMDKFILLALATLCDGVGVGFADNLEARLCRVTGIPLHEIRARLNDLEYMGHFQRMDDPIRKTAFFVLSSYRKSIGLPEKIS